MKNLKARSAHTVMSAALGAVLLLSLPIGAAQADHRNLRNTYNNHNGRTVIIKTIVIREVKKISRREKSHGHRHGYGNRYAHHHPVRHVRKHRYYEHQAVYYPKPVHYSRRPVHNSNFNNNGELGGRIVGAILGGAAGTQFGKGKGRTVAIIGGAIIGSVIGGEVVKTMR